MHMQISEHYPAFLKKTLLVLTNNELAKLYSGEGRVVEALEIITTSDNRSAPQDGRKDGIAMVDTDAEKRQRLVELYGALNDRLLDLLKHDYAEIILCVPEANKNELTASLHADVDKRVKSLVPKNLASMELNQVMRILFET